jgi:hypothetical protein
MSKFDIRILRKTMKQIQKHMNGKPPKWYLERVRAVKKPPQPSKKVKCIHTIWGGEHLWKIEDQICRRQSNAPHKYLVVQRIHICDEQRYEYRFGYYMIGFRKGARGKWTWGQFSPMIPEKDLTVLIKTMRKKKWIGP